MDPTREVLMISLFFVNLLWDDCYQMRELWQIEVILAIVCAGDRPEVQWIQCLRMTSWREEKSPEFANLMREWSGDWPCGVSLRRSGILVLIFTNYPQELQLCSLNLNSFILHWLNCNKSRNSLIVRKQSLSKTSVINQVFFLISFTFSSLKRFKARDCVIAAPREEGIYLQALVASLFWYEKENDGVRNDVTLECSCSAFLCIFHLLIDKVRSLWMEA